jgi:quercetin dioxygenase-like cupin family protein
VAADSSSGEDLPARFADAQAGEWQEHPRFAGVLLKGLLTAADNALASVNVVRVPPGREIGWHRHAMQVETIYVLAGQCIFWLGEAEVPMRAGQIVAVPIGVEHGLRNPQDEPVELLTVFTPPLS